MLAYPMKNVRIWFRFASVPYMHGISKSIRKLIKASLEHDTHRLLRCLIEMLNAYRLVYELIHTGMYEHDTMLHVPFLQNIHEKTFA